MLERVIKEFIASNKTRDMQIARINIDASNASILLQLKISKGGLAIAKEVNGDFIVLTGSQAKKGEARSLRQTQLIVRERLRQEHILVEDNQNNFLLFTRDISFSSPSAVASIVTRAQANGHILWKVEATGQTYRERN